MININDLPDLQVTAGGNPAAAQILTTDNLSYVVGELGMALRYNVMEHVPVFVRQGMNGCERDQEVLYQQLCDTLLRLRIKSLTPLGDMLGVLARGDRYHPMADWIPEWDGVDRFEALVASVPTDSAMWRVYLEKWLVQVCEAIHGWDKGEPRSLPNVLCFVGDQGIGKGRWLRALAPPAFVMADAELHLGSTQGKDHQVQALRYPIVELGEIDSTFRKADVSALKAFLSRQTDEIREPYARKALKHLRGTVFFGSVNDAEFLNDGTGTRRYWPVGVTGKINWDHGIDMPQLWAQATHWWEDGDEWFLDDEQEQQRVEGSESFVMVSPVVDLVAAHIHDHCEDWGNYVLANKTEVLMLCGIAHPTMAQVADVTRWMTANYGPQRKLQGKQRCWAVPAGTRIHLVPTSKSISDTYAKKIVRWGSKRLGIKKP